MNAADVASVEKAFGGGYPQYAYYYDANENLEYVAIGDWGAASSDAKWRIFKLTYNANNSLTSAKSTQKYQILDGRLTATYG